MRVKEPSFPSRGSKGRGKDQIYPQLEPQRRKKNRVEEMLRETKTVTVEFKTKNSATYVQAQENHHTKKADVDTIRPNLKSKMRETTGSTRDGKTNTHPGRQVSQ